MYFIKGKFRLPFGNVVICEYITLTLLKLNFTTSLTLSRITTVKTLFFKLLPFSSTIKIFIIGD